MDFLTRFRLVEPPKHPTSDTLDIVRRQGLMSKIDVIIPCYNYGRFLEECVRSVVAQQIADLRILIIDDASIDDSLSVAKQLAASDRRISVVAHPSNRGHIATYN